MNRLIKNKTINSEKGNRLYVSDDDYVTQMRKQTQQSVDNTSPQVQSEMVRPYAAKSYAEHEYYKQPPSGITDTDIPTIPDWEIQPGSFILPAPVFVPASGNVLSSQKISLLCSVQNAEIHFTDDRRIPTRSSQLYQGPFSFIDGAVYSARAFLDGWERSPVSTAVYHELGSWIFASIYDDPNGSQEAINVLFSSAVSGKLFIGGATRYWSFESGYPTTAEIRASNNNGLTLSLKKRLGPGPLDDPDNPNGDMWIVQINSFCENLSGSILLVSTSGYEWDGGQGDEISVIWKSTDYGETWSAVKTFTTGLATRIIFDVNNSVFIVHVSGDGFYNSSDGETWSFVESAATGAAVLYDEVRSLIIGYIGSEMQISSDGGNNWTLLTGSFISYYISHDPIRDVMLCVGVSGYLYRSEDGGANWTLIDDTHTYSSPVYDQSSKDFYVVADDKMVLRSSDAGITWSIDKDFYTLGYVDPILQIISMPLTNYMIAKAKKTFQEIWRRAVTSRSINQPAAPVVTGTTPTTDTTPTWTWSASGNYFRYKLDDSDLAFGATETQDLFYTPGTPLSLGGHTLYVEVRNKYYWWSNPGSFEITIEEEAGGWTVYFDNTYWEIYTPGYGLWDTDHWVAGVFDVGGGTYYQVLSLGPIGGWEVDFRPTKVRITHDSPDTPDLYIEGAEGVWCFEENYVSGTEIDLAEAGDLVYLYLELAADNVTPYNVTNIEFY